MWHLHTDTFLSLSLFFSRLALYVYEYLLHVGAQKSAQTFLSEVRSSFSLTSCFYCMTKNGIHIVSCSWFEQLLRNPTKKQPSGHWKKQDNTNTSWAKTCFCFIYSCWATAMFFHPSMINTASSSLGSRGAGAHIETYNHSLSHSHLWAI